MTLHESEKLLKSQSARGCCSCLQSSPFSPAIDLMMHYLSLHTGLFLLRKNKLPPGPGLASQRKYCKHLSHRQNNIQGKGSHKKLQAVWSGAIPRNSDKRKTVRQKEDEQEVEGTKAELPTPNNKTLGNTSPGSNGSEAGAAMLSSNLPHSSIYEHQLPQKRGCLLSINRNHSPVVHLIMRPHTEFSKMRPQHC